MPDGPFAVVPRIADPGKRATGPFTDPNDALMFASAQPNPGTLVILELDAPPPNLNEPALWVAPDAEPSEGPIAPHACPFQEDVRDNHNPAFCTCSPEQVEQCAENI